MGKPSFPGGWGGPGRGAAVLSVGPSSAGRKVEKGLSFANRREAAAETLASTWGLGVDTGQGLGWPGREQPSMCLQGLPGSSSGWGLPLKGRACRRSPALDTGPRARCELLPWPPGRSLGESQGLREEVGCHQPPSPRPTFSGACHRRRGFTGQTCSQAPQPPRVPRPSSVGGLVYSNHSLPTRAWGTGTCSAVRRGPPLPGLATGSLFAALSPSWLPLSSGLRVGVSRNRPEAPDEVQEPLQRSLIPRCLHLQQVGRWGDATAASRRH